MESKVLLLEGTFHPGFQKANTVDANLRDFRNIQSRKKAIAGFSKDIKVILLSLENAASGTNLTQATHIVLMGTWKNWDEC